MSDDLKDANDAYFKGEYELALQKFKLLAEKKDPHAEYSLGVMYLNGHGVTKDYNEAIRWFRLSAEQDFPQAQLFTDVINEDRNLGLSVHLNLVF